MSNIFFGIKTIIGDAVRTCVLIIAFIMFGTQLHAAEWITAKECGNEPNTWICFQKRLKLNRVGRSVPVRIAADSKYWLYINGEKVVIEGGVKRGPSPAGSYFDTVDIAPFLRKGENVISVLVWYFGKDGFSHKSTGAASLFMDGEYISTDSSWVAGIHPSFYTPGGENPNYRLSESNIGFDSRRNIGKWTDRYNEEWPHAQAIGGEGELPWGKLSPRIIPQWRDYGLKDYVSKKISKGEKADTVTCKLPYNCHAMPYMEISAPAGLTIDIRTDNYRGGGEPNVRAEYITCDGNQSYENPGWMNGENVIYTLPHGISVSSLKYRETGYDTDFSGRFECSDPFFNEFWEKARRTLYVTMRDTYMDCPDRERAQWWGDAVNESGEAFYALSPSSHLLMKKGMYELINWQRPDGVLYAPVPSGNWENELPGQILASIGYYGFWNYYMNTGDLTAISDLYDGVARYMSLWQREKDGTIIPRQGGWHWGDWGENIDKKALYNAWYYIALSGQRNMAAALGRHEAADSLDGEMRKLKAAFNRKFWNGCAYRSPDYHDRTDDRVQALAVVSGLADSDKYQALLTIFRMIKEASPYMEKYVGEALFVMGYGDEALSRTKSRFKAMVDNPDYTTLFEGWGIGSEGYGGGTTNHAWSGGTLTLLSQYVCGIAPTKPGYETFAVAPQPSGLQHASTSLLTVKGEVSSAFTDNDSVFTLDVKVPDGTVAAVRFPYCAKNGLYLDDRLLLDRDGNVRKSPSYISFDNSQADASPVITINRGGTYHFKLIY